jgi:eukaryotic-like serine/threonine-protein kinase
MDLVAGLPLNEEMERRQPTATLSGKLHILSHLSNAIRFLEEHEIAHLDLTPSNVMVCRDYLVKLVDFGEAYHRATSNKFSQEAAGRFLYSPGRTFPYAPPETSTRLAPFSSQQDMYSLGVILHQLIFADFPFTCHQDTHKLLYRTGSYTQRLLLAPERAEDYGQAELMAVLMNLAGKLM